jgi:hypothetical protein
MSNVYCSGVLVGGMGMGYSAVAIPDILAEAALMTTNNFEESTTGDYSAVVLPDIPTEAAPLASNKSMPEAIKEAGHLNFNKSAEENTNSDPLIPHIMASAEELSWFGKNNFCANISQDLKGIKNLGNIH